MQLQPRRLRLKQLIMLYPAKLSWGLQDTPLQPCLVRIHLRPRQYQTLHSDQWQTPQESNEETDILTYHKHVVVHDSQTIQKDVAVFDSGTDEKEDYDKGKEWDIGGLGYVFFAVGKAFFEWKASIDIPRALECSHM